MTAGISLVPPQDRFPLRVVVPGWYGTTNVKWLQRIDDVEGRAWSGHGEVTAVDVSVDGGVSCGAAELLAERDGRWAWRTWRYEWFARPRAYVLCCRADDAAGTVEPLTPQWNVGGYANNAVQRVLVTVR